MFEFKRSIARKFTSFHLISRWYFRLREEIRALDSKISKSASKKLFFVNGKQFNIVNLDIREG